MRAIGRETGETRTDLLFQKSPMGFEITVGRMRGITVIQVRHESHIILGDWVGAESQFQEGKFQNSLYNNCPNLVLAALRGNEHLVYSGGDTGLRCLRAHSMDPGNPLLLGGPVASAGWEPPLLHSPNCCAIFKSQRGK